jgi:hypothetical protein
MLCHLEDAMNIIRTLSLRQALLADALVSGLTGLLLALGAGFLASFLNLPEALLRYAGAILLPYAALVALIGTRRPIRPSAVWVVIAVNALWALDSVVLLLSGWVAPNIFGAGFIVAQAVVVALFAELQYLSLRRRLTRAA